MSASKIAPLLRCAADSPVLCIAASHDGTRIVSGSFNGLVRIWDIRTGSLILAPLKGNTCQVCCVAWSHDDERVASASFDAIIRIWDARTGDLIGEPVRGPTSLLLLVSFSSDITRIVSTSNDSTIHLWDTRTGATMGEPLRGHAIDISSVAFSADSAFIVCGSSSGTILIWDVLTSALVGEPLEGHTDAVTSVSVSPDSTHIVSGSRDMTICIWDVRTGAAIRLLKRHTSEVNLVAFSPDNTRIVSCSWNYICVWEARTGAHIGQPLRGHALNITSVAFSGDSTRIVSGSNDYTVHVWEAPISTFSFDVVMSDMSAREMFNYLVKHGCADLSSIIDPARYSTSAVASGGFGDVWKAQTNNDELVAVKCLRLHIILEGDPKGMKRATRELHHWSKARHENIQELLGIVMFQDRLGMVSLWRENGNLQQYIEKNPNVERYPLCEQVARGVAYMHRIGMVHGDLKAVNVLVSSDGVAKITDFDYSMLSESTLRFSQTTRTAGGTARWMAPELLLLEDDGPLVTRDTKTDVYALGMTMLEIISGDVPYSQYHSDVVVSRAVDRRQPPRRPQELSASGDQSTNMWSLLLQCWDHDPSARPDAWSVLTSLQRFTA